MVGRAACLLVLPSQEGELLPMRVACPNCSTEYDVPAVHFVDGARKLRCTECGYRWNQTATEAQVAEGKKSTPLLDMLEPAMDVEKAPVVDIMPESDASPTDGLDGAVLMAAELDPAAADRAYEEIDAALSPLPAPKAEERLADVGRQWRLGLGIVALTVLVSGAILGREAVVSAAPFSQSIYRALGLEPWSALREWDLCLAAVTAEDIQFNLTNQSAFRRSSPDIFLLVEGDRLAPLDAPWVSLSQGESIRAVAPLNGQRPMTPPSLALSADPDQSDAKVFSLCL